MSSKRRRFEVLLPLRFNDGREVPKNLLGEAVQELFDRFGAVSVEKESVEGRWRHRGLDYRDDLSLIVVDVADTVKIRRWMRAYKTRWKKRLQQIELWMVSYRIEVE